MAIYCSQGHPNPDGADFQRACRTCGEDMLGESLLSNPPPGPPVAAGSYAPAARAYPRALYAADRKRAGSAAVWSLVLGILSIALCSIFTGIPAIVMGNKSRRIAPPGESSGLAIAGLTLGWISVAFFTLSLVYGIAVNT